MIGVLDLEYFGIEDSCQSAGAFEMSGTSSCASTDYDWTGDIREVEKCCEFGGHVSVECGSFASKHVLGPNVQRLPASVTQDVAVEDLC
jgi:hypothetical protein